MRDILRDIAPLLGVLLPAIAAFFMYRRTEDKRERDIKEGGKAGLLAGAAGALASVEGTKLYIQEFQSLAQTGDKIAAGLHEVATAIREATDAQDQRENDRLAKAIEELTKQAKAR